MVNFYQLLLDKTCMVSSFDANGIIRHVNEKFCMLSGYTEQEAVGSSHSLLRPGVDEEPFYSELWKEISQDRPWTGLICNKAKDGKIFWTASSVIADTDPASENRLYYSLHLPIDEPAGLETLNRNISERKEVEERLRFQNERLSEIAWLHAHKVRGPVATIMGLMNIYDWDDFSADGNKDIVRKVDLVSKQLDVIIHDIVKKTGELHDDEKHA